MCVSLPPEIKALMGIERGYTLEGGVRFARYPEVLCCLVKANIYEGRSCSLSVNMFPSPGYILVQLLTNV